VKLSPQLSATRAPTRSATLPPTSSAAFMAATSPAGQQNVPQEQVTENYLRTPPDVWRASAIAYRRRVIGVLPVSAYADCRTNPQ
jgi:hypothetical protein